MGKEELVSKYHGILQLMAVSGEVGDIDELLGKLAVMVRKHYGDLDGADVYLGVPDDFDWKGSGSDFKSYFADKSLVKR